MVLFESFVNRMSIKGVNVGEIMKKQSDMIMDVTFNRDIGYRVCYLQDKNYLFPEQTLSDYKKAKSVFAENATYNPKKMKGFKPIEAKYNVHTYYSISKDEVDYYLQFRPTAHGTNPNIRVGAFIFIPDDLGVYNLWLIVARDDRPQFPQYYILKINMLLKWYISPSEVVNFEGHTVKTGTYYSWAVQRTQSSYNSGVWTDYYTTTVENQLKAIVPTNMVTNTITYNERFVICENPIRRVSWETTKVETTNPRGLTKLTFAQQLEYDPTDNLSWVNTISENYSDVRTGIDYDYYQSQSDTLVNHGEVSPADVQSSVIEYTGTQPTIKVGGSYKKLTARFYKSGEFVPNKPYWSLKYLIGDEEVFTLNWIYDGSDLIVDNSSGKFVVSDTKVSYKQNNREIFGIQYKYDSQNPLELKIKCLQNINMIGNKLVINVDDDIETSTNPATLELEVVEL